GTSCTIRQNQRASAAQSRNSHSNPAAPICSANGSPAKLASPRLGIPVPRKGDFGPETAAALPTGPAFASCGRVSLEISLDEPREPPAQAPELGAVLFELRLARAALPKQLAHVHAALDLEPEPVD